MENIPLPSKINFQPGDEDNVGILTVEPCYPGYGITIGNSLRRVLLSSLPGAAVKAVKIKNAPHEFSTLPNIKEDIIQIVLNLKSLRLKVFSEELVTLNLKVKGEKKVTAKDITANSEVEITNKNMLIATLTDNSAELDMDIVVSRGRGYVPAESQVFEQKEIGLIAVDSIFTPVQDVSMSIERVRVGQMTNYDKLILKITTNGIITPAEAMKGAVDILMEHFTLLVDFDKPVKVEEEPDETIIKEEPKIVDQENKKEEIKEKSVMEEKKEEKKEKKEVKKKK